MVIIKRVQYLYSALSGDAIVATTKATVNCRKEIMQEIQLGIFEHISVLS